MPLTSLVNSGSLERIEGISLDQIEKKMTQAARDLKSAELLLQVKPNDDLNSSILKVLYDSGRILTESILLLKGYRAKQPDYHKKVFQAAQIIVNDENIKSILLRLNKTRIKRNHIDYDPDLIDTSSTSINQALSDITTLLSFVRSLIIQDPRHGKIV